MSHRATVWAFEQRGLTPAQRVVLLYLADRHNPDFGCFPSQAQLAEDCEISRRSLNAHLGELEAMGLIRRERRVDATTRRQKSTRYILGFEFDGPQGPCADPAHGNAPEPCAEYCRSRVQNLHTNLVREPVSTTAAAHARDAAPSQPETALADDAGPVADGAHGPAPAPVEASGSAGKGQAEPDWLALCLEAALPEAVVEDGLERSAEVLAEWRAEGFDLRLDVLPVIHERTRSGRKAGVIRSWRYFSEAIAARHRQRLRAAARPAAAQSTSAGQPADPVARLAAWINGSRFVPPSAVTNTQRDALLARRLVTALRLRELGIR